jgi:hypothetical protein
MGQPLAIEKKLETFELSLLEPKLSQLKLHRNILLHIFRMLTIWDLRSVVRTCNTLRQLWKLHGKAWFDLQYSNSSLLH